MNSLTSDLISFKLNLEWEFIFVGFIFVELMSISNVTFVIFAWNHKSTATIMESTTTENYFLPQQAVFPHFEHGSVCKPISDGMSHTIFWNYMLKDVGELKSELENTEYDWIVSRQKSDWVLNHSGDGCLSRHITNYWLQIPVPHHWQLKFSPFSFVSVKHQLFIIY